MVDKSPSWFLKEIQRANKGRLKVYLGSAPGVGKTYKMLMDGNYMKNKGIDIVIGLVETYKREDTEKQIGVLEVLPLKEIHYKGYVLKEIDVDGIINRNPQLVIIDELAHTNAPTSKNAKRYEDVLEIIDNGISVMTAVNIQHLESLNNHVNRMTGVKVREKIPDSILDLADEVEVVDVTPYTLRERIAEGKVYSEDKINVALNNFFREGNLFALRELALREVANEVDERLIEYKNRKRVNGLMGAQEKILVCVHLRDNAEYLIRRGFRLAKMLKADLFVLYVRRANEAMDLEKLRIHGKITKLSSNLGAKFSTVNADDPAIPIIKFADEKGITQIIIGESARTRVHEIMRGSIVRKIMKSTKYVDVLVVSDPT